VNKKSYQVMRVLKWFLKHVFSKCFPNKVKIGDGRLQRLRVKFIEALEAHHQGHREDFIKVVDSLLYIVDNDSFCKRVFFMTFHGCLGPTDQEWKKVQEIQINGASSSKREFKEWADSPDNVISELKLLDDMTVD
jgi:hypothetical protein